MGILTFIVFYTLLTKNERFSLLKSLNKHYFWKLDGNSVLKTLFIKKFMKVSNFMYDPKQLLHRPLPFWAWPRSDHPPHDSTSYRKYGLGARKYSVQRTVSSAKLGLNPFKKGPPKADKAGESRDWLYGFARKRWCRTREQAIAFLNSAGLLRPNDNQAPTRPAPQRRSRSSRPTTKQPNNPTRKAGSTSTKSSQSDRQKTFYSPPRPC